MKVRSSNIELLRIVCMLMVLAGHANGYINEEDLAVENGITRLLINQFCLVSVNVFVMISGWFGIKASWKGAGKLLFQVFYITLFCAIICFALGQPVSLKKDILPYLLFGSGYWFVVSYLVLYAISPVLNSFIDQASQKQFRNVWIAWFSVEIVYGFLLNAGYFNFGFSPMSFVGLYLLARYVRLYPGKLFSLGIGADFAVYISLSLLSAVLLWAGYKWFGMGFHLNHYDSPLAILASLFFLLAFSKMDFQSRIVNWLASSAFAIYLIHEHSLVSPWYHQLFSGLGNQVSSAAYYPLAILLVFGIAIGCILVDKPRMLLWGLFTNKYKTQ